MSLNKEKIFQTIIENQSSIKLLGAKNLALFGSFVRNEQKENSDIDFLVEFNDGQSSYDNYIELSFLLEDIFKRKIDLLTPKSMSPYIGPYILKELEYVPLSA
ncbi:MAG: nucleotidyltransferase family protein [Flavobacteriales bacterium]